MNFEVPYQATLAHKSIKVELPRFGVVPAPEKADKGNEKQWSKSSRIQGRAVRWSNWKIVPKPKRIKCKQFLVPYRKRNCEKNREPVLAHLRDFDGVPHLHLSLWCHWVASGLNLGAQREGQDSQDMSICKVFYGFLWYSNIKEPSWCRAFRFTEELGGPKMSVPPVEKKRAAAKPTVGWVGLCFSMFLCFSVHICTHSYLYIYILYILYTDI